MICVMRRTPWNALAFQGVLYDKSISPLEWQTVGVMEAYTHGEVALKPKRASSQKRPQTPPEEEGFETA